MENYCFFNISKLSLIILSNSMRVFITEYISPPSSISPSSRCTTLWFENDKRTIGQVKTALLELCATCLSLHQMAFYFGDRELTDADALDTCASENSGQVHILLVERICIPDSQLQHRHSISHMAPLPSSHHCNPFNTNIEITFRECVVTDVKSSISLRNQRNYEVCGTVHYDTCSKTLSFSPTEDLFPNTTYTVFINGFAIKCSSSLEGCSSSTTSFCPHHLWSFTTTTFPPLRLYASLYLHVADDTDFLSAALLALAHTQDTRGTQQQYTGDTRQKQSEEKKHGKLLESRLVYCTRSSPTLRDEFIQCIFSSMQISEAEYTVRTIYSVRIDGGITFLDTNRAVSECNGTEQIHICIQARDGDNTLTDEVGKKGLDRWTKERWDEYYDRNKVNAASGYFAICGKMTLEEENDLLCQIVSAFILEDLDSIPHISIDSASENSALIETSARFLDSEPTDNNVLQLPPSAVAFTAPTYESTEAASLSEQLKVARDSYIPIDNISQCWSERQSSCEELIDSSTYQYPKRFKFNFDSLVAGSKPEGIQQSSSFDHQKENLSNSLTYELQQRGYAFVEFDEGTSDIIDAAYDAAEIFFKLELSKKLKLNSHRFKYLGYINNAVYNKEFFQIRKYMECDDLERSIWPCDSGLPQFRSRMDAYYTRLHTIAAAVSNILLNQFGFSDNYIFSLFEPAQNDISFGPNQVSRCNTTLFHYRAAEGESLTDVHCPYHSDISLVTVIPRGKGGKGLHIFDWKDEKWIDVETNAPSNCGVVFVGELMGYLTGQKLLPCVHDVSHVGPGSRLSLPFQFCAADWSVLDPSESSGFLKSENEDANNSTHDISREKSHRVLARDFLDSLSAKRISSNFLTK